jgi:hypothetical protein
MDISGVEHISVVCRPLKEHFHHNKIPLKKLPKEELVEPGRKNFSQLLTVKLWNSKLQRNQNGNY